MTERALSKALLHPANRPLPLIEWLTRELGVAMPHGVSSSGGLIRDFRMPDTEPSLNVRMGERGVVVCRFGGDRFQGGAVDFVMSCLGLSRGEAVKRLIERTGGLDTPQPEGSLPAHVPVGTQPQKGQERQGSGLPLSPAERDRRLQGWVPLDLAENHDELAEFTRRGLLPALESGLVRAYRLTDQRRRLRSVLPGAVAFEVQGPGGEVLALKVRNPGTRAELADRGVPRYSYLGRGQGTPAWCSAAVGREATRTELWIEGELSGVAVAHALSCAGLGHLGVQGVAGTNGSPMTRHLRAGDQVLIYADEDTGGKQARVTWEGLARQLKLRVVQLPAALFAEGDACDTLSQVGSRAMADRIKRALDVAGAQTTSAPVPVQDVWVDESTGYGERDGKLCALKRTWEGREARVRAEVLSNFTARIVQEVSHTDGQRRELTFVLEVRVGGSPPQRVQVRAAEFGTHNWVLEELGAAAILFPGAQRRGVLTAAIQILSGTVERVASYGHTGWHQIGKAWVYLTAGAVIGTPGALPGITVELPERLRSFALPAPATLPETRAAVRASLALLDLVPDTVGAVALAGAYRAPLGQLPLTLWIKGVTGMNKTTLLALIQAHYGPAWTRAHLPEAWTSSANALEQVAFLVKDMPLVVDDYKPQGNQRERNSDAGKVARLIQAVADGQGRSTMTADRQHRAAYFPRGTLMSSAEALPTGHSNRARTVITEVRAPLIGRDEGQSQKFYDAETQAAEGVYAQAMAGYVQFLAGDPERYRAGGKLHKAHLREWSRFFEGEHGRTAQNPAELSYGWRVFLSYALHLEAISPAEAAGYWERVVRALEEITRGQDQYLRDEDPAVRAVRLLSELLMQGKVFLDFQQKQLANGLDPLALGWIPASGTREGAGWTPRPGAVRLGRVERVGRQLWAYLSPETLHAELQQFCARQGAALPEAGMLWAALQARFMATGLMRCNEGRPTYRSTAPDGTRPRVIALALPLDLGHYEAEQPAEGGREQPKPVPAFARLWNPSTPSES